MTGTRRVFIDANVFVVNWVTDVLLTFADWNLVSPFWSNKVMSEAAEAIRKVKGLDPSRYIDTIRDAFDRAEVLVTDADLAGIELPDPNDCHVVARAREAGCDVIVTYNLKDFPDSSMEGTGVRAVHPDELLAEIASSDPEKAIAAMEALISSKQRPPRTMETEIEGLRARGLIKFADLLTDGFSAIGPSSD